MYTIAESVWGALKKPYAKISSRKILISAFAVFFVFLLMMGAPVTSASGSASIEDSRTISNTSVNSISSTAANTETTEISFGDGSTSKELNNWYDSYGSYSLADTYKSKGSLNNIQLETDQFQVGKVDSSDMSHNHIYVQFEAKQGWFSGNLYPVILPRNGASAEGDMWTDIESVSKSEGSGSWDTYTVAVNDGFKEWDKENIYPGGLGVAFRDDGTGDWTIRNVEIVGWRTDPNLVETDAVDPPASLSDVDDATLVFDYEETSTSEAIHDGDGSLEVEAMNAYGAPEFTDLWSTTSSSGTAHVDILSELQSRDSTQFNFFVGAGSAYDVSNMHIEWELSDSDDDGIPDVNDECVNAPEDQDGYEDGDGCPENPAPSVSVDGAQLSEDGSATLTASATDPEGESLLYDWSTSGEGTITGSGSSVTYEAPSEVSSDISETVSVTVYEPDQDKSSQDSATISIENEASNDDPDGDGIPNSEDECKYTPEDQDGYEDGDGCPENPAPSVSVDDAQLSEGGSTTLTVSASDPEGESLSYDWSVTGDGSITGSGSSVTYMAPSTISFDVSETVSVTVYEPDQDKSSQDSATVTINDVGGGNSEPDAYDVSVSTSKETSVSGSFDATDPDGDALSYSVSDSPSHGSVSISGDTFTYTPETGYSGGDSFTYQVDDGQTTDTATVDIMVASSDQPYFEVEIIETNAPVTEGDTLTVQAEVKNTGGGGESYIDLFVDGGNSIMDYTSVELQSGETTEVTLEYQTENGDAPGVGVEIVPFGPGSSAAANLTVTSSTSLENDEYEPNDDLDSATEISSKTALSARILGDDTDIYEVGLTEGETLKTTIQFNHENADLQLAVGNEAGSSEDVLNTSTSTTNTESVSITAADNESYYIVVTSQQNNTADYELITEEEGISIDTGFVSGVVTNPENNSPVESAEIVFSNASGVVEQTTTNSGGEYSAELPVGGYTINVTADGYVATEQSLNISAGMTVTQDIILPTAQGENDEYEPNDGFETAASITAGSYPDLQISNGESDYYAVTLDDGESVEASINSINGTDNIDIGIYGPNEQVRNASTVLSDGKTVSTSPVTQSGTYYIRVYGGNNTTTPYNLTVVTDSPSPPSNESVAQRQLSSTQITPGGSVTASVDATAQSEIITVSEFFTPKVANASVQSITVDGEAVSPILSEASPAGVVVTVNGLTTGQTVEVEYTVEVAESVDIGTTYTITGNVTSGSQYSLGETELSVQEDSPLPGVAGQYDQDQDGSVQLIELSAAASDYVSDDLTLIELSKVASAYTGS